MAEEAIALSAGNNRACSNGESGKDEHGSSKKVGTENRDSS